jgi:hypothetical protein
MGYRSEVALAVSKEIMPHFLGVLAKEPDARSLIFKHHNHLDQDYNGEGTLLVIWYDIKWYDSCAEINALNDFIELCEADMLEGFNVPENGYQGEHIRFVRLGEDSDDYVEKGTLHDWDISMSRSLMY